MNVHTNIEIADSQEIGATHPWRRRANQSYFLNAGTRDDVEVWKHGAGLYVLTLNSYCGYIGLDAVSGYVKIQ
jgi:hypothetical protein